MIFSRNFSVSAVRRLSPEAIHWITSVAVVRASLVSLGSCAEASLIALTTATARLLAVSGRSALFVRSASRSSPYATFVQSGDRIPCSTSALGKCVIGSDMFGLF